MPITLTYDLLSKIPYRRGNSTNPKIIFVGTAPGKHEFSDAQKRAFIGAAGQVLDNNLIAHARINQNDCYFTNVLKERIPDNKDAKWIKENPLGYETYLKILEAELNLVASSANIIVPCGDIALQAICGKKGITNWRGSIISSKLIPKKKCIPVLHPASILRTWSELVYTKLDFYRIAAESKTSEINLPKRTYIIRPSFDTAIEYLTKYINTDKLISCDIETLRNIRPNRIVSIQFADSPDLGFCLPFQYRNGNSYWSVQQEMILWRMIHRILTTKKLIGQNFCVFDTFMLHFNGIPYRDILKQIHMDVLEAFRCLEPELPASQAFLTSIYTREPFYKAEGKSWESKQGEDEFWTYGCKDVCILHEIQPQVEADLVEEKLLENYKRDFRAYAYPRMKCSVDGILIDMKKREALSLEYSADIIKEQAKLTILAGQNINVKSTPQMKTLLYDTMKLPKQYNREGGVTTDEDALLNLSTKSESTIFPLILHIRHLRTIKSSSIDVRLDSDNHIRSSFGWTETHRLTSSSCPFQTGTNLQNQDKKMRAMFIAPPGYILGKGDLSQAEARIVAWKGRMVKSIELFLNPKRDIHKETAAEIFTKLVSQITKEERYSSKRIRYGVNYDMHANRFAKTYNKDAGKLGMPFITESRASFFITRFHEIEPDLKKIYHQEIKEIVSKTKTLYNFFSARMRFHDRVGDELFRAAYSWYAQSTVAYLTNSIWKIALSQGINVIHQNHDELVWLSKVEDWERDNEIMYNASLIPMDICGLRDVPPLIIPFEIENGPNWYETKLWEAHKAA